jgi:hypothetical protein
MNYIILAALLIASPASAQTLTDSFGTTITKAGNVYTRGGVSVNAPSDAVALNTFNAMAPDGWVPPSRPPPTSISSSDFIKRLTPAERLAIATAGQSNAQILVWLTQLGAATTVIMSDPDLLAGVQAMVSAGLLTSQRAAQILDLSQTSP